MANTINEARTPGELAAWLRQWADGADASDSLDDNDARQLAEAIERVCAPGNAAILPGRVPEKAGAESCPFVGVDLANGKPTYTCVEIAPGNAAAMRAALLKVLECYKSGAIRTEYNDPDSWKHDDELCYLKDDVEAALVAPARNCDVGTAAEQAERFKSFCDRHARCGSCPFDSTGDIAACPIEWAQMPFVPAKGGAE